jgi:hypothetical protein
MDIVDTLLTEEAQKQAEEQAKKTAEAQLKAQGKCLSLLWCL